MHGCCFQAEGRAGPLVKKLAGILVALCVSSSVFAQAPGAPDMDKPVVLPARAGSETMPPLAVVPATVPSIAVIAPPKLQDAGRLDTAPRNLISGFAPTMTLVPQKPARSVAELKGFFEDVNSTDGMVEVVLGQGCLLTLKQDLAFDRDRPRPLIAVGDPSVLRVVPASTRQLRLIGLRFGTTDLSITTWDSRTYTLKVQVVADLDVLQVQLRATFPDAAVKVSQIHDHLVVEGEARDATEIARILETIKAYVLSLQSMAAKKITGESVGSTPTAAGDGRGTQVASTQPGAGVAGGREPL